MSAVGAAAIAAGAVPATANNHNNNSHNNRIFAPLNIPLIRRLQTFAVLLFFLTPIVSLILNIYCVAYAPSYVFYPYLVYLAYSLLMLKAHRQGGEGWRWETLRSCRLFEWFTSYFPVRLHKTHPLTTDKSYIVGYHPHGIISIGAVASFATNSTGFSSLFPGLTSSLCTLDVSFRLPFWNALLLTLGLVSATKESIDYLCRKKGSMIVLVLGGAKESLDAFEPEQLPPLPTPVFNTHKEENEDKEHDLQPLPSNSAASSSGPPAFPVALHLAHRRGFVSLGLSHGCCLVPAFGFGELSLFNQYSNPRGSVLRSIQEWVSSIIGFATPLFGGRGILQYRFGVLPHRREVDVYIGAPIQLPMVAREQQTSELLDKYHKVYCDALVQLFEAHKKQYPSTEQATLVFVD